MTIPLIVLAVGSIVSGYIGFPAWLGGSNAFEKFLEPVFEPLPIPKALNWNTSHCAGSGMAAVSVAIALLGFLLAYFKYCRRSLGGEREKRQYGALYALVAQQVVHR